MKAVYTNFASETDPAADDYSYLEYSWDYIGGGTIMELRELCVISMQIEDRQRFLMLRITEIIR
jgi:hypothetical protein